MQKMTRMHLRRDEGMKDRSNACMSLTSHESRHMRWVRGGNLIVISKSVFSSLYLFSLNVSVKSVISFCALCFSAIHNSVYNRVAIVLARRMCVCVCIWFGFAALPQKYRSAGGMVIETFTRDYGDANHICNSIHALFSIGFVVRLFASHNKLNSWHFSYRAGKEKQKNRRV